MPQYTLPEVNLDAELDAVLRDVLGQFYLRHAHPLLNIYRARHVLKNVEKLVTPLNPEKDVDTTRGRPSSGADYTRTDASDVLKHLNALVEARVDENTPAEAEPGTIGHPDFGLQGRLDLSLVEYEQSVVSQFEKDLDAAGVSFEPEWRIDETDIDTTDLNEQVDSTGVTPETDGRIDDLGRKLGEEVLPDTSPSSGPSSGPTDYETELLAFMLAIGGIESGGASDPLTATSVENSGGRGTAKGIFQFLDATWRGVAPKVGVNTPTASTASGDQQWKVAAYLMTQYFKQLGDWGLVAAAWFAGPQRAQQIASGEFGILKYTDAYGTSVLDYMRRMTDAMDQNIAAGVRANSPLAASAFEGASRAGAPAEGSVDAIIETVEDAAPNDIPNEAQNRTLPPGGLGGNAADYSIADINNDGVVGEDELFDYVRKTYPQMLWALEHPELSPILRDAAERGLDAARIYGQLIQTEYWKNHPESERALENLRANDPATWKQMIDQRAASVRDVATALGWNLQGEELRAVSEQSLLNGWNSAQLEDNIVQLIPISAKNIEAGVVFGKAASTYNNLRQLQNSNLLQLSDADLSQWTQRIMRGEVDEQAFGSYAQAIAESQFPWMSEAMSRGVTPQQFAAPYVQWVSETLEMNPNDIDIGGEFRDAMYDAEAGRTRTLPEVQRYIRETRQDQWQTTDRAHQQYSAVVEDLAKTFGRVG